MRFAYSIKQKIRIAILLFAVMACTILIRVLEDKSVKSMNESFVSLYNDRLIPATDLFYIAENANAKKSLLEAMLYAPLAQQTAWRMKDSITRLNTVIDSLVGKYKRTFLVQQEKAQLPELDKWLRHNANVEAKLLELIAGHDLERARTLYESTGRASIDQTIRRLSELMSIQKQVGEELLRSSAFMVSGSKLYSTLQVALAIVIGILIVGIVFTSNVVKISNDKFRLN